MLASGLGGKAETEGNVTYVVLEIQGVDIFGTALGLLGRGGHVRASDARLVDVDVNVDCLRTLGRGRTVGDGGSKVDALSFVVDLFVLSGNYSDWHLGRLLVSWVLGSILWLGRNADLFVPTNNRKLSL